MFVLTWAFSLTVALVKVTPVEEDPGGPIWLHNLAITFLYADLNREDCGNKER